MIKSIDDLEAIREAHAGQRIVFCSGGFDLTHAGHLLFFEDCKRQGDILVVGVASDATRRKERGMLRPILNEHLRASMVAGLKPVDYVFLLTELAGEDDHPQSPLINVFRRLKPDVWVVNSDGTEMNYRQALADDHGVELVILERTAPPEFEEVSTTAIIEKIVRTHQQ